MQIPGPVSRANVSKVAPPTAVGANAPAAVLRECASVVAGALGFALAVNLVLIALPSAKAAQTMFLLAAFAAPPVRLMVETDVLP